MPLSTARFSRHGRPPGRLCGAPAWHEGPNQNPLLVGEVTGMRRSRKGHLGQNGPVAIWLLAPTPKSVAKTALIVANPFAQGIPAHLPFQWIGATWS
jgi:hypothetical protein